MLSLREIMIVASICGYPNMPINLEERRKSYEFPFQNDRLIRDVIGECIPPLLTYHIGTHITALVG